MALVKVMDALETLYASIADQYEAAFGEKLRAYRWKPDGAVELPAIYTWVGEPSPTENKDVSGHRVQDHLRLVPTVAQRWVDDDERMKRGEVAADLAMQAIDQAVVVRSVDPFMLNAGVAMGRRFSMRPTQHTFGEGLRAFVIELPIELDVNRIINH